MPTSPTANVPDVQTIFTEISWDDFRRLQGLLYEQMSDVEDANDEEGHLRKVGEALLQLSVAATKQESSETDEIRRKRVETELQMLSPELICECFHRLNDKVIKLAAAHKSRGKALRELGRAETLVLEVLQTLRLVQEKAS